NIVHIKVTYTGIAISGKKWLTILPEGLMCVHSRTVVSEYGFWHKRNGSSVLFGNAPARIFVPHHSIAHLNEWSKAHINLGLTSCGNLMVMFLNHNPEFLKDFDHL